MYLTVTDAGIYNIGELKNAVIRNDGKRIIKLQDIAEISVREKTEFTRINANGRQGLLVAILKQPAANLIDLSDKVSEKKAELEKILPPDVHLSYYYNQADFVKDSIKSVNDSIWIGLLLAIIVAVLFLRSFRASATILVTIPVTLLLTVIVLYSIGYTLNIMTFGAIAAALGLIIDDAVVPREAVKRTCPSSNKLPAAFNDRIVHKHNCDLLPVYASRRGCRGLFQCSYKYNDRYPGLLIPCYMDWITCNIYLVFRAQTTFQDSKETNCEEGNKQGLGLFLY
jgi:multidrug efflux pump subunit AcrB